jgi:hypothetical protein
VKIPLSMAVKQCGECRVCCEILGIVELGKPYYVPCTNLSSEGCSIYGSHPPSCKDFACLWLAGVIEGDERRRPDQLGVMFQLIQEPEGAWVDLYEVWLNASTTDNIVYLKEKLVKKYPDLRGVRFHPAGAIVPTQFPIDSKTYRDDGQYREEYTYGQSGNMALFQGRWRPDYKRTV